MTNYGMEGPPEPLQPEELPELADPSATSPTTGDSDPSAKLSADEHAGPTSPQLLVSLDNASEIAFESTEEHPGGRLRKLGRVALHSLPVVAVISALPSIEFWWESPIFAKLVKMLAPEGFMDLQGAATSLGILGGIALANFGVGITVNKVPMPRLQEVGPLDKTLNFAMKPLKWVSSTIDWVGSKLNDPKHPRLTRFVARQVADYSEAVSLGTACAVMAERDNNNGKALSKSRIAKITGLLALGWIPTYDAVYEVVYRGVYQPLNYLEAHHVPAATLADEGVHDAFYGIGTLFDPTKLPGQFSFAAIMATYVSAAVLTESRRRRLERLEIVSPISDE